MTRFRARERDLVDGATRTLSLLSHVTPPPSSPCSAHQHDRRGPRAAPLYAADVPPHGPPREKVRRRQSERARPPSAAGAAAAGSRDRSRFALGVDLGRRAPRDFNEGNARREARGTRGHRCDDREVQGGDLEEPTKVAVPVGGFFFVFFRASLARLLPGGRRSVARVPGDRLSRVVSCVSRFRVVLERHGEQTRGPPEMRRQDLSRKDLRQSVEVAAVDELDFRRRVPSQ